MSAPACPLSAGAPVIVLEYHITVAMSYILYVDCANEVRLFELIIDKLSRYRIVNGYI